MKKLLVLAALSMAAAPAMASKARLTSLGNASHLVDTQTIFVNPADLNYVGDFATLEFGNNDSTYTATGVTRGPKAEGGFTKTLSWGKVGAYLGHRNDAVTSFVDGINVSTVAVGGADGTLLTENNPLDLFYGNDFGGMKWGFDLHYSNSKNETATVTQKETTTGISAGVRTDVWNAALKVGLQGKSESDVAALASPELKQKGYYRLGGGYWFDTIYAFANYEYAKGTATIGGSDTDITRNNYEVGMVNNHKLEGGNFFYGVSYLSQETKTEPTGTASTKLSQTGIPLVIGMELDAASWLTLRGSVKQTILVGENKNEKANTKSNLTNDTTVAAGAGLKWGKIELDGTLAGSTTGNVDANTLLAEAALTYNF